MTDEETKALMKAALKEWLDDKVLTFGHWSIYTLMASGLFAFVYFLVTTGTGFHK